MLTTLCAVLIATALTACGANSDKGRMTTHADTAPILLFNGTGTSGGDVAALEKILTGEHLDYSTADSPELNAMSETQIRKYRLLIVPGGNFEHIGNSLASSTAANIVTRYSMARIISEFARALSLPATRRTTV
jgi:hypothetical protein